MRNASILTVLLALGIAFLVSAGSDAMVAPSAGLQSTLAPPAIAETVALRKSGSVRTRRAVVRHRGVAVRTRHVAVRHRAVAATTRHVTVKHRSVAARKTRVAAGKRRAVAVRAPVVVRPVRPWVRQPYYGVNIAGVTLGTVIAAHGRADCAVFRSVLVLVECLENSRLLGLLPIGRSATTVAPQLAPCDVLPGGHDR